jgi:PAP2 superfamily
MTYDALATNRRPARPEKWMIAAKISGFAGIALLNFRIMHDPFMPYALTGFAFLLFMGKSLEALALPLMVGICAIFLRATVWLCPHPYDAELYRFDGVLRFHLFPVISRMFLDFPVLRWLCQVAYDGIMLILAVIIARAGWRSLIVKKLVASAVVGCSLFFIMPAQGPAFYALGVANCPRNAIPSLHMTWPLLLLFSSKTKIQRIGAWILVLFTVLATLGIGQHYVVDLVVAVPFALCIHAAFERDWSIADIAAGLTIIWLLVLRFAFAGMLEYGWLWWMVAAVMVSGCIVLGTTKPERKFTQVAQVPA